MKIIITQEIPKIAEELLKKAGHSVVVLSQDGPPSREKLLESVKGADAMISVLSDKIDGEVMDGGRARLKIIANYAVGYDNIDLDAAKQRNIVVTNTPGVLTEAVAEHTVALMFAVAKRITESDKFMRAGEYKHWLPMGLAASGEEGLGQQLWGKTIGIVGLGRIGSFLAEICYYGLKMKIVYNDVKRDDRFEMELKAQHHELPTLLAQSDVVSINVPLVDSTRHLISAKELQIMKKTAILINTSRGAVIDENALVAALREHEIAGAGLDVFENEPDIADGLKGLSNVVLTPHSASATLEARLSMAEMAAKNIIKVLAGGEALNPVE